MQVFVIVALTLYKINLWGNVSDCTYLIRMWCLSVRKIIFVLVSSFVRLCFYLDHVRPDWQENIGSSSRNTSSNGSTRRTVVRPLQAATIDLVSNISSSVESTDSMPEDFLVMEYLRLGTIAARQEKESVTQDPTSTQIQSPSSSSLSHF